MRYSLTADRGAMRYSLATDSRAMRYSLTTDSGAMRHSLTLGSVELFIYLFIYCTTWAFPFTWLLHALSQVVAGIKEKTFIH